ncbi:hypothetical protein PV10_03576 [Exophiala mesophila]|uniref:Forkhead box protein O n=1 Tax=Exophiala mesophila TaxID=212818 RepID=A0A0D1Y5R2_EXOME|nr:uncharacterized protein PV10_03576 [Exophiala mesophila]KIV95991.1 hypothetical protein PV10_03576 [Exophiala mesophila]
MRAPKLECGPSALDQLDNSFLYSHSSDATLPSTGLFYRPVDDVSTSETNQQWYDGTSLPAFEPKFELEDLQSQLFNNHYADDTLCPYQGSYHQDADVHLTPTWLMPPDYPHPLTLNEHPCAPPAIHSLPGSAYTPDDISTPYSSYYLDESSVTSAWSSPGFPVARPALHMLDDGDATDDKPYAALIYDALLQAPNHRMMLREIYDWFRVNTNKVQDNGSNGWQNSIRHNLSMNKAFENDREAGRSNSRKATSVWVLTEEAIRNGVQSTTRYRKSGGGKRAQGHRTTAVQRQRSGARGGRAARQGRTTRHRRHGHELTSHPSPAYSSFTPSYSSDTSDYHGLGPQDLGPAFHSCPLTPVEGHSQFFDEPLPPMTFPITTPMEFTSYHPSSTMTGTNASFSLPLRPSLSHYIDDAGDMHPQ